VYFPHWYIYSVHPLFNQLRDIWAAESVKEGGIGRVDALSWLSKLTLDVIGLAGAFPSLTVSSVHFDNLTNTGFNYTIDALTNQRSELSAAFDVIFKPEAQLSTLSKMKALFPILRFIVSFTSALRGRAMFNAEKLAI
jgi:hypothetical protein